jgi:hypothetical protein
MLHHIGSNDEDAQESSIENSLESSNDDTGLI